MRSAAISAALCVPLLAACGVAYPTHPPVPPTPAEQVPAPPRSPVATIWRPGHYDWTGRTYVWIPGEWVERAGHGTLWQDGYWEQSRGVSRWVPAHWI